MTKIKETSKDGKEKNKRQERIRKSLNTQAREFLGGFEGVETTETLFPGVEKDNAIIQLERFLKERHPDARFAGFEKSQSFNSLASLESEARYDKEDVFHGQDEKPLKHEYLTLPGLDSYVSAQQFVLFFQDEGEPALLLACVSRGFRRSEYEFVIELASRDTKKQKRFIDDFRAYESKNCIFRGKILSIGRVDWTGEVSQAEVIHPIRVDWDDLIVPESVKSDIREAIFDPIDHGEVLEKNGFELKRGVLFFGPPGTGKSFAARITSSLLKGYTSIWVSGQALQSPTMIFSLARRYAPSLVVLEDIDLVGETRDSNDNKHVLGGILNELDGIEKREKVHVLFTTNNIECLEKALVERPGRVDQCIEFPLPGPELRKSLLQLYALKATLDIADYDPIIEATKGTSPAFIKEVMKRAAMNAIKSSGAGQDDAIVITGHHVQQALERLGEVKNRSVKKILGFAR